MADYIEFDERDEGWLNDYLQSNNAQLEELYFDDRFYGGARVRMPDGRQQYIDFNCTPIENTDFGSWDNYSRGMGFTPYSPSLLDSGGTSTYYTGDRKKKSHSVEELDGGAYYRVGGNIYTRDKFVEKFGSDYYQTVAYYNEETHDMQTARRYYNGEYRLDTGSGETKVTQAEFGEQYKGYKQMDYGGRNIFVDAEGRFHQIEFNGDTIVDSTDPSKSIKYTSAEQFEGTVRENGWQVYHDEEDIGFHSSAILFFSAETKYIAGAEWYGARNSLFQTNCVTIDQLINIMDMNTQPGIKKLSEYAEKLSEYDSSLTSNVSSLKDDEFVEFEYNEAPFEDFKSSLQSMVDVIETGQEAIDTIKNNLMQVDGDFSNDFENEYNQLLRKYLLGLQNSGEIDKKTRFFSQSMLNLLNRAMDKGLLTGSDLELFKRITDNTHFAVNATDSEKFWNGVGVVSLSFLEGLLSPVEAIADGVLLVAAGAADLVGERDASNTLLGIIARETADEAYTWATDTLGINYDLSHGDLHEGAQIIGDITGDALLWCIPGGQAAALINGAKAMGKGAQTRLNGDFEYDNNNDRLMLYLNGGKDFALGYGSKKLFSKGQEFLGIGDQGQIILARNGPAAYYAYVQGAQAFGNAGIQLGSNLISAGIDLALYGETDVSQVTKNVLQAFVNGVAAPNKWTIKGTGGYGTYANWMTGVELGADGKLTSGSTHPNKDLLKYGLKALTTAGELDIAKGTGFEAIGSTAETIEKWGLTGLKVKP